MKSVSISLDDAREMKPVGEVSEETNGELVELLNDLLANEFALFTKTLNYHWNVTGPRFYSIHLFLEEHYKKLLKTMDDVAERVRILDDHPLSTVEEMQAHMGIAENPHQFPSTDEMLNDLLRDHLTVQSQILEILDKEELFEKDPGTQDFLIKHLEKHEKMSWMLKAHFH